MIKIDLHTHSIISPDGGIREVEYGKLLKSGVLDCIAVTDHNQTNFAKKLHEKFGDKVIIGEEITTTDGEMIGLFLKETIRSGLSARESALAIRKQGGLVYIPHPFETARQGIQRPILEKMVELIDIIEVFNGRGKGRGRDKDADAFCTGYHLAGAASSDAHGFYGAGKTFSNVAQIPTRSTLVSLLNNGSLQKIHAPFGAYFYPTMNRIKKILHL